MQNKQLLTAVKHIIHHLKEDDPLHVLAQAIHDLNDQNEALKWRVALLERKLGLHRSAAA